MSDNMNTPAVEDKRGSAEVIAAEIRLMAILIRLENAGSMSKSSLVELLSNKNRKDSDGKLVRNLCFSIQPPGEFLNSSYVKQEKQERYTAYFRRYVLSDDGRTELKRLREKYPPEAASVVPEKSQVTREDSNNNPGDQKIKAEGQGMAADDGSSYPDEPTPEQIDEIEQRIRVAQRKKIKRESHLELRHHRTHLGSSDGYEL